jgi:hypothetical protein
MRARSLLPVLALLVVSSLPRTARAQFSTDAPLLAQLLATGMEQLKAANAGLQVLGDNLATARGSYATLKQYVGYARDAKDAFGEFQHLNASMMGRAALEAVDRTYPETGYFQREIARPGPWAQGTGMLAPTITFCVEDAVRGDKCREAQDAIKGRDALLAVQATFGTAPAGQRAADIDAADAEAAAAIAGAHSDIQRHKAQRAQLAALTDSCVRTSDAVVCTAAANMASMLQAQAQLDTADAQAEANRLQAVRIAQESAKRKAELRDRDEQIEGIKSAVDGFNMQPAVIHSEGDNIFGGAQ